MQLTDRIHLVASGAQGFGLTHPSDCHAYLIDGGSEAALIDAGAGVDAAPLFARLAGTGVATDRVRQLDGSRAAAAGVSVEEVQRQTEATIPLGRYGDTAEIGRMAAFLLSPAASYVTGAIVPVDGGLVTALP